MHVGPRRLETPRRLEMPGRLALFRIKHNESQFESIWPDRSHRGHCWTPNQEKGRGREDNSDEI